MSDNLKTARPDWRSAGVGYLVAFMRDSEEIIVFKIRRWRCCFYSPIRCETVELLFNFIGGGLVLTS
jgi:hypothetical protein